MSHCIESTDLVLSDRSPEWHGLARVVPSIGDGEMKPLLFHIDEGPVSTFADTGAGLAPVSLPGFKALTAIRDGRAHPLAVHADTYKVIENSCVWEALKRALKNHPHTVTTAGTLGGLRRFFISVQLHDAGGFKAAGDDFRAYLNFITSHDGTLALKAYDSHTRIVCQNTLNASLATAGKFGVSIRHTSGASAEIRGMEQWIDATLEARRDLGGFLDQMAETPIASIDARKATAGWLWEFANRPAEMGTRYRNHVDGIVDRFAYGRGTHGRTVYDLWNGVTEYYTSGAGAGKTVSHGERVANSFFGGASERKADFTRRLLKNPDGLNEMLEAGQRAVALLS